MLERLIQVLATIICTDSNELPAFAILSALNQSNQTGGSQRNTLAQKGYMNQIQCLFIPIEVWPAQCRLHRSQFSLFHTRYRASNRFGPLID